MSEVIKKSKHINFAISGQYEEVASIIRELEPLMPPKDRGVMVRGVIWCVRHIKCMHDDLEAAKDKIKVTIEDCESQLRSMRHLIWKVEQERDEAKQELAQLQERAAIKPNLTRTVDEAKRLIGEGKCPICGGALRIDTANHANRSAVKCRECNYFVWGTLDEPLLKR
jgi:vacuolar-type H+-ATPase subunit I/STV1